MMNDTVARIVDLMFENVEMNEEVAALRDEVMNNCQERYRDLIASGVPEDDAVGSVVESLKGMEDVIAQYRCKHHRQTERRPHPYQEAQQPVDCSVGSQDLVFIPAEVERIDLSLISEDVVLESSDDGLYHVRWDADESPAVCAVQNGGTLKINRNPDMADYVKPGRKVHMDVDIKNGTHRANVFVNGERISFDEAEKSLENVGSMMENLGRSLGKLFGSIRNGFGGDTTVTIAVPHGAMPHAKLVTTSGDLCVKHVELAELNVISTSGDIEVEMNETRGMNQMNLRTTSGDIDVTADLERMSVSSTSGDVDVQGRISQLNVSTVSGDIDVRADVQAVNFKAISGDVDLAFEREEIHEVRGSTISGDIDVRLPSGIGVIAINTHTRSGDVTSRYAANGFGPMVSGDISTLSGDITIR